MPPCPPGRRHLALPAALTLAIAGCVAPGGPVAGPTDGADARAGRATGVRATSKPASARPASAAPAAPGASPTATPAPTAAPTQVATTPVRPPGTTPPALPAAPLSGLVRLPAGLIGMDGGSFVGGAGPLIGMDGGSMIGQDGGSLIGMDGGSLAGGPGAGYRLAQAPLPPGLVIEVALTDARGAFLPGTGWVRAGADGRYQIEQVPATGAFVVQARATLGGKTRLLGAIGRLAGATGTVVDVTGATTLVASKARVVVMEQDLKLDDLQLTGLAPLVAGVETAIAAGEPPDYAADPVRLAAALDARLQAAAALRDQARAVGRQVGTPIVRAKQAQPFASGIFSPEHLAFDAAGNLFVAGLNDHTVWKVPAGGTKAEPFFKGGDLKFPFGVACDAAGNVYVGRAIDLHHSWPENPSGQDTPGKQVFKIDPTGKAITALSHVFKGPAGMAFAKDGKTLLVANSKGDELVAYDTATDQARVLAGGIPSPVGVAVDSQGVAYVTQNAGGKGAIAAVAPDGKKTLFYDAEKDLAGKGLLEGVAVDAADNVYATNNWGLTIFKFTPRQKKIETYLKFDQPTGLAFDPRGNLVVANYMKGTLSLVTP